MKVQPVGLPIDFAKKALPFLPLKQTGLLLNMNILLELWCRMIEGYRLLKKPDFHAILIDDKFISSGTGNPMFTLRFVGCSGKLSSVELTHNKEMGEVSFYELCNRKNNKKIKRGTKDHTKRTCRKN